MCVSRPCAEGTVNAFIKKSRRILMRLTPTRGERGECFYKSRAGFNAFSTLTAEGAANTFIKVGSDFNAFSALARRALINYL